MEDPGSVVKTSEFLICFSFDLAHFGPVEPAAFKFGPRLRRVRKRKSNQRLKCPEMMPKIRCIIFAGGDDTNGQLHYYFDGGERKCPGEVMKQRAHCIMILLGAKQGSKPNHSPKPSPNNGQTKIRPERISTGKSTPNPRLKCPNKKCTFFQG